MSRYHPHIALILILLLAFVPLAQAGHGPVLAMGEAEHSESMTAEHGQDSGAGHHAGGHDPMSDCHGSDTDMDCCASCVGCAIPLAASNAAQAHADPGAAAGTFPPTPDPERQQRPPRLIIS